METDVQEGSTLVSEGKPMTRIPQRSEGQHIELMGDTGAGKTTALDGIRPGAEANGYVVEGFAPTSRAAQPLRDSGIAADTLQGFLARGAREQFAGDPERKHLYMLGESSLASIKQMRDFLERIGSEDKVVLIGDTRQHLGADAGKPFEQLQEAGMRMGMQCIPQLSRADSRTSPGQHGC